MKAYGISASKDSLWVIEKGTAVPHKFDELNQTFVGVGTRKAYGIYAGLEGHAVMRG